MSQTLSAEDEARARAILDDIKRSVACMIEAWYRKDLAQVKLSFVGILIRHTTMGVFTAFCQMVLVVRDHRPEYVFADGRSTTDWFIHRFAKAVKADEYDFAYDLFKRHYAAVDQNNPDFYVNTLFNLVKVAAQVMEPVVRAKENAT